MLRIATRLGIIACRYMVNGYYNNRYISAPEIAEHYKMNVRALMPSLRQMTRAGILRSRVGGKTPGFIFAKDPKEITLFQIFLALEGDSHFECCKLLVPGLDCDCKESSDCGVLSMFNSIINCNRERMSAITIADNVNQL